MRASFSTVRQDLSIWVRRVGRHPLVAALRRQTGRFWTGWLRTQLGMGRDMLVAPLSLLTLQFLRGSGWVHSKYCSLVLLVALFGLGIWLAVSPSFYVGADSLQIVVRNTYEVRGLDPYLPPAQVWNPGEIIGTHILWQHPGRLQGLAEENPFVDQAHIRASLPDKLIITVQETRPALIWVTDEALYAVLEDGTARRIAGDPSQIAFGQGSHYILFDLKGAASLSRDARHPTESAYLDPELVKTMQALRHHYQGPVSTPRPPLQRFRYSQAHGLNLVIPESETRLFWGNGDQLEQKIANLSAIEEFLSGRGEIAELIDVRPLTTPYYRQAAGQ